MLFIKSETYAIRSKFGIGFFTCQVSCSLSVSQSAAKCMVHSTAEEEMHNWLACQLTSRDFPQPRLTAASCITGYYWHRSIHPPSLVCYLLLPLVPCFLRFHIQFRRDDGEISSFDICPIKPVTAPAPSRSKCPQIQGRVGYSMWSADLGSF